MDDPKNLKPVRARIKDFQSIEDLEIEIRGFTCITGNTNVGKSAIMRAIRSSIQNNPVSNLVRRGAKFTSVELESADWGFKWEKGERGINRYTIGDRVYDKIGQKQLDVIEQMGFGSVRVGDQDLYPWSAPQFFPLFLLDQTGSRVTEFISEVSRLTVLQDAITLASRGKRKASDDAKAKSEEASKYRDRATTFVRVDDLGLLHEEIEQQVASITEYEEKIARGESILEKLEASAKSIELLQSVSRVRIPEDDVRERMAQLQKLQTMWEKLELLANRIIAIRGAPKAQIPQLPTEDYDRLLAAKKHERIFTLRRSVDALSRLSEVQVPDQEKVSELDTLSKNIQDAKRWETRLAELAKSVVSLSKAAQVIVPDLPPEADWILRAEPHAEKLRLTKSAIEESKTHLEQVNKELSTITREMDRIPKCPTCGKPATAGHSEVQALSVG